VVEITSYSKKLISSLMKVNQKQPTVSKYVKGGRDT
jgi:hypothetical protein